MSKFKHPTRECSKCKFFKKALKQVIAYPPKEKYLRTRDGFPQELIYDEFAYNRMVNSYRIGLKNIILESKYK